MAEKKQSGRNGGTNKSEFIRQHPNLPAAEVVAKAKEAGLVITPTFVHNVRSRAASTNGRSAKAKRRPKAAGNGNASAFIREQLENGKSPGEIMAEGQKAGLKFSRNLIYAVKASSQARSKGRKRSASAKSVSAKRGARPIGERHPAAEPDNEVMFRKLAFEMGLVRARALLDDLEVRLVKLLRGG